ncbi:hypothetical protein JCM11641_008097 [Rhodosporidiobolus odoratus]
MHFFSILALTALALTGADAAKSCHRRHHSKAASFWASSTKASASGFDADATHVIAAAQVTGQASASGSTSWSSKGSSSSASDSWSSSSSSASNSSSDSSSSSSKAMGWGLKGMKKNGIYFGFLPDDGSGGGSSQTIHQLNTAMGQTAAAQGWYAQAQSGTLFDGSQFKWRKDQIISGGVFQPAVMPTGGWWGLTEDDNQQAVAICKVMKEYTDEGVEVWLRFAHEVNYYLQDGTYSGTIDDFKEAWGVVAKACKSIAPEVKMWFTPNVDSLDVYQKYFPDDPSTVHIIGVDWYPKQTSDFDFANGSGNMKKFHDAYTGSGDNDIKFAIGEIGLGVSATMAQRLAWAKNIMESGSDMPNLLAVSWFNYYKDNYSYKVAGDDGDSVVKAYFSA